MVEITESESEAQGALDQANPAAVSLALRSPGGKGWETDARAFLRRQAHLLDLQIENLNEERHLQLAHLKTRRWKDRLAVTLQTLTILAGLAIVAAFGVMAWDAHNDHGLVVEAFSVPPELAARGLSGQAVAGQLQDWLSETKAKVDARTARAGDSYRNDWGADIKVEIPQTGVSLGEIQRLLRQWLGHETRISGQIWRGPNGLMASARIGDLGVTRATGSDSDIEGLIARLGEGVFAAAQPYRYAVYLGANGRRPESLAVLRQLATVTDPTERAWANIGLGNTEQTVEANAAMRRAIALDPTLAVGWNNLANGEAALGHDEAALKAYVENLRRLQAGQGQTVSTRAQGILRAGAQLSRAAALGDFRAAVAAGEELVNLPSYYSSDLTGRAQVAQALAQDHDVAAALTVAKGLGPDDVAISLRWPPGSGISAAYVAADQALDDWPAAARAWKALDAAAVAKPELGVARSTALWPFLAEALVRSGDVAAGLALIARTPSDCYACLRARGRIAAAQRDWPKAQAAFAEAARQAPSLPMADYDWGQMLLAKGDLTGAIGKLRDAHAKGPHFADPLELWGEVLLRQGDPAGAAVKFAEAAKWAPRWGRDHLKWSEALAKLGKTDAARAQRRAAATMDLTPTERAQLQSPGPRT